MMSYALAREIIILLFVSLSRLVVIVWWRHVNSGVLTLPLQFFIKTNKNKGLQWCFVMLEKGSIFLVCVCYQFCVER